MIIQSRPGWFFTNQKGPWESFFTHKKGRKGKIYLSFVFVVFFQGTILTLLPLQQRMHTPPHEQHIYMYRHMHRI